GIVQGSVTNETQKKRLAPFPGRGLRQDGQNAGRGTEISRGLGLEPRRRPSPARPSSSGQKILSCGKLFNSSCRRGPSVVWLRPFVFGVGDFAVPISTLYSVNEL